MVLEEARLISLEAAVILLPNVALPAHHPRLFDMLLGDARTFIGRYFVAFPNVFDIGSASGLSGMLGSGRIIL